jgi:hypothetical protein
LGLCALDIETGNFKWCRSERYISNIGIDADEAAGYILRSDFILEKVDLSTGATLAEIQFFPIELPREMQNTEFEYSISVTKDVIIVSFGDSGQTFALRNIP